MADPREVIRGTVDKGVGTPDTSASAQPPRAAGTAPPASSTKYVSHVVGHRRLTMPQPAPRAEPISDFERGLAQRPPHFTVITRVPLTSKAAAAALPGWSSKVAVVDVENALANAKPMTPYVAPMAAAAQARGVAMPADLLAGWMSQESSGRPYFEDKHKLDEVGLMQISREERKDYLGSTEPGGKNDVRAKMLDQHMGRGAKAQLEYAAKLMAVYQGMLEKAGMPSGSPAMAKMIRFGHNLGIPKAARLTRDIATAAAKGDGGLDLSSASYNDVVKWAATHGRSKGFLAAMRKSDYAALAGQKALEQMAAPGN